MNVWSIVKRLSFKELCKLGFLLLQKPFFILPTIKATRRTLQICNKLYKDSHHKHGRENAFRHALWNVLIAQYTFAKSNNEDKSVGWTEIITDLHETLYPNAPLEKAMDLHNNRVGRMCFLQIKSLSEEKIIQFLQDQMTKSVQIKQLEDIKDYLGKLVYLEG